MKGLAGRAGHWVAARWVALGGWHVADGRGGDVGGAKECGKSWERGMIMVKWMTCQAYWIGIGSQGILFFFWFVTGFVCSEVDGESAVRHGGAPCKNIRARLRA